MGQTAARIDRFLLTQASRFDRWRAVTALARKWRLGGAPRSDVETLLAEIEPIESYHAYPGPGLLSVLREHVAADDADAAALLARRISDALLTRSYRDAAGDWEQSGTGREDDFADIVPTSLRETPSARPYFEALFLSVQPASRWRAMVDELRRLRRPEDEFVYEPVVVGSFEDALCAIIMNPDILAVVIPGHFPLRSRYDAPVLREMLDLFGISAEGDASPLTLAGLIKRLRPEMDVYVLSDEKVEELAGDPAADSVRRIFYAVEEPLELHLSVLEGIRNRYKTPFFDNLKAYAQRPIGTFHALPIARGKSIFKSGWIRDLGDFYGLNLFLAESSATTGGLDSLLEPTGNIKVAQDLAARAFGADRVYFVTNGTSTSNKMVVQALLAPGDIAIVDRNCHKSHHYGLVLSGAQPVYVEAFPLEQYSMYGAVPLAAIKQAMLDLKASGELPRLKLLDLTNCTFDGHMYNVRRVMEECLAIKPDLIFLWDEAWSGFARFSPFLRPRTAMGAADEIDAWRRRPAAVDSFREQRRELGEEPTDEQLMATRLIPDPEAIRLRVYQTNSTHKSMSAIRQGSMLLVKDDDFRKVEPQFREAVFTHASTSPNQQLIASLDVARRQMELEGYGLVMNAIDLAIVARRAVNQHPVVSRYFRILDASEMIPEAYRASGFSGYLRSDASWADVVRSMREDEFYLDPTRMTLVCGTAGFDGTQFKGLMAADYGVQVNKTSRNSVLIQTNINNTRSDIALLIRMLVQISREIDERIAAGGPSARTEFDKRVRSLMEDVPGLPNFSHFHPAYTMPGSSGAAGDMRSAFFDAYDDALCEYVPIFGEECDKRLKSGPEMISASFVIPYPPGFPIMVPGQVITSDAIDFMRKLDVKEIHGYERARGLKLLKPDAILAKYRPAAAPARAA